MVNPKLLRAVPLIVMLLLAIMLAFGLLHSHSPREGERPIGYAVSPFDIPSLSGQRFSPATWHGRVALLNAFASWCESCTAEHDMVMKIAHTGKVAIYGLAWRDKPEKVTQWISVYGNPYQSIGVDEYGKSTVALALTGVPETFVFDKNGAIAYHYAGILPNDIVDGVILPLVEKLNAE